MIGWGSMRNPAWSEFARMQRSLDELARHRGGWERSPFQPWLTRARIFPSVNVSKDNDSYVVTAEIPGINTEDLEIKVEGEIDRYCAWPGQACGYKVGHLEILRLRDKAKQELGDRFGLPEFDYALVKGGGVPMTLLDTVIDQYIETAKTA